MTLTFILTLAAFNSAAIFASSDIHCDTEYCDSLSVEQHHIIEKLIDVYIEKGELKENQAVVVLKPRALNLKLSADYLKRAGRHESLSTKANKNLGLSKAANIPEESFSESLYTTDKPFMVDRFENYMGFRYKIEEENDIYISADVRMQNGMINKDLKNISVNTIGFGTKTRDAFIVEIGVVKKIAGKSMTQLAGLPDGLAFKISRRWK